MIWTVGQPKSPGRYMVALQFKSPTMRKEFTTSAPINVTSDGMPRAWYEPDKDLIANGAKIVAYYPLLSDYLG